MEILIYSARSTFRLKYVLNTVFKDLLGIGYRLTNDKEEFTNSELPKINYSQGPVTEREILIKPSPLLFQTGIKEQNLQIGEWQGLKILFSTHEEEEIPFDIFASVFFMLSRYEEYLPHIRDQYDRFEAESSIAYVHKFLETPIVNYWVQKIKKILAAKYPGLQFKEPVYRFISTIDIDNAFAFYQKGVMRTIGGYARGIVNLNWTNIKDRSKVLAGTLPDPFDSYAYQLEMQKKYNLNVIYFFLLGDYGINDKNLPSNNRHLQKLIKHLGDYAKIGIHPSFGSNDETDQVRKEINRLSYITHRNISDSRQHFARLHFPSTYKALIENGIQNDYSMGYHNFSGFRAGISNPYYWYDIDTESETNLKLFPYIFSESTLKFSLKLQANEALNAVKGLINEIKKTGGTFTSMFHNESLGDYGEWNGWRNFYEEVIQEAV
ncbi:MAG: polysaccharide deacetylase family protein [Bacteroidia bacterium]|nr:polysaccharide deacetylase family protein [Bacteroidia bacterium]